MKKENLLVCCAFLSFTLSSCQTPTDSSSLENSSETSSIVEESSQVSSTVEESSQPDSSSEQNSDTSTEPEYVVDETFNFANFGIGQPTVEDKKPLDNYTPTTFSASSYSTSTTNLSEGVDLVVASFKLSNGQKVNPHCVVVDLNKANVVAGTTNNATSLSELSLGTPYAQATAYENANPGVKVIAATNADFFGGANPVNAFVKDGKIVKPAHNSDATDVPISVPMLFGVSSAGARIGPMTNLTNYSENQNSKLSTRAVTLAGADGANKGTFSFAYDTAPSATSISVLTKLNTRKNFTEGTKVYKFKKIQTEECKAGEIRGCVVEREYVTSAKVTDERYGYIILGPKFKDASLNVGDYFVTNDGVFSVGGMWDHYHTIIGARHSLIENGVIPSSVAKEWQNGASSRVPRTAVGITVDGKVVIVSVEDTHYGVNKGAACTGIKLTELADFMRYFGCYDAANFDGGGSSQLIARSSKNSDFLVRTKSSDTNSTNVNSTRKVVNSILVTTK